MPKTTGDGPARSSTGHHFGVRAALRERVPIDWGRTKDSFRADIAAYNARQAASRKAKTELTKLLRTFPKLRPIADRLRGALSDIEILEWPVFKDQRSELERRRAAALGRPLGS